MRADALAHGNGGLFALHPAHAQSGAQRAWGEPEAPPRQDEGGDGGDVAGAAEGAPEGGWLRVRPYGVPTERDKVCEAKWRPVYRTLLVRTQAAA